jgi:C4-dicarboxylate-specific signal transduction histidine kinase
VKAGAAKPVLSPSGDWALKPGVKPERANPGGEYQRVGSDIFHELSQPLSTLVCLLEVNLMLSRPAKQLRHDLQIALKQANSVVRLHCDLRELWDAGNAQQDQEELSLTHCLQEAVTDLLPVAELAKVTVSLTSSSDCRVVFQANRLRQALVHLLDFALDSCVAGAAAGKDKKMIIAVDEENQTARVTVAVSAVALAKAGASGAKVLEGEPTQQTEWKDRELKRRLRLAIARRIFESANGSLQVKDRGEQLWLEVRLPVVSVSK